MGLRYLYLVRHGQYRMASDEPRYGSLTDLGRRQAKRLGKRLAEIEFDSVTTSDLTRAQETAAILHDCIGGPEVAVSAALREGLPSLASHWQFKLPRSRLRADRARMDIAFEKFFRPPRGGERHELIVGHGNCIRYLVRKALGDPTSRWWRMEILQCSLSIVCVRQRPGSSSLVSFGDVGHLPRKMQTFS